MKVWIYKYALTKGVFPMDAKLVNNKYASGKVNGYSLFTPDWAEDRETAERQAELMRDRRIVALKKQIAKLEKLTFENK